MHQIQAAPPKKTMTQPKWIHRYVCWIGLSLLATSFALSKEPTIYEQKPRIQVGNIIISNYIYDRELNRSFNQKSSKETDSNTIKKWKTDWINKLLIACEARELGYDKDPDTLKSTEILANHMLTNNSSGPYANWLLRTVSTPHNEIAKAPEPIKNLIKNDAERILESASKTVDPDTLKKLLTLLPKEKPDTGYEARELSEEILFHYTTGKRRVTVTVQEFINHYNNTVVKHPLTNYNNISKETNAFIINKTRMQTVQSMNLDKDWHFLQERENFINNTIYIKYINSEIRPSLSTTHEELKSYFYAKIDLFKTPKRIKYLLITSPSQGDAIRLMMQKFRTRNDNNPAPSIRLRKSTATIEEFDAVITDNNFELHQERGVFSATLDKPSKLSKSPDGNYHCCMILKTEGTYTPRFKSVFHLVEIELLKEKESESILKLVSQLKRKHKILWTL